MKNQNYPPPRYPPKEKWLRQKWSSALKMTELSPGVLVCSQHFRESDYFHPGIPTTRYRLKKGSIPSQNLPVTLLTLKKRNPEMVLGREQRAKKRAEEKLSRQLTKEQLAAETDRMNASSSCTAMDLDPPDMFADFDMTVRQIHALKIDAGTQTEESSFRQLHRIDKGTQMFEPIMVDEGIQVGADSVPRRGQQFIKIITDEQKLNAFTGLHSFDIRDKIESRLAHFQSDKEKKKKKYQLSVLELIMLTFIKLKLNISYTCIGTFFDIPRNTCRRYFIDTVRDLSSVLSGVIRWNPKQEILDNIPKCFANYVHTRVILDCFEIPIQRSKWLKCRLPSYSNYKCTHTVKIMVGVTPSGCISFLSNAFVGRTSDKQIFQRSNLAEKLIPGVDCVMVDKGFLIDDICAKYNIKVIIPPFLRKKKQFSEAEAIQTAHIAAARVHVERRIQRLRLFAVIRGPLSLEILPYLNMIVTIVGAVNNLGPPILSADKFI